MGIGKYFLWVGGVAGSTLWVSQDKYGELEVHFGSVGVGGYFYG